MQDFFDQGFGFFRGRVGLAATLRALGVSAGDDVAIQAFTCIAVPEAVAALAANPVYVDMTPKRFTTDPEDLERKITEHTRAIVVQHTYGIAAEMDTLVEIADRHGIPLIEDCCHTIGTSIGGKAVGHWGAAGFYSFEAGKPVIAGLGGWVSTSDSALQAALRDIHDKMAEPSALRQLQVWGMYMAVRVLYRPSTFWHLRKLHRMLSRLGLSLGNYDLDSEDAGDSDQQPGESTAERALANGEYGLKLGGIQLRTLKGRLRGLADQSRHRREIAGIYSGEIGGDGFTHPELPENSDSVLVRYPLMHENRDHILGLAEENKIELSDNFSSPVHPVAHVDWHTVGYEAGSCPNAEYAATRTFALPTHAKVSPEEARRIAAFLKQFA